MTTKIELSSIFESLTRPLGYEGKRPSYLVLTVRTTEIRTPGQSRHYGPETRLVPVFEALDTSPQDLVNKYFPLRVLRSGE